MKLFSVALLALMLCTNSVAANETVYLQFGNRVGGLADSIHRVVGAHLGKYLPNAPQVVVQSVPGAAGVNMLRRLQASDNVNGEVIAAASVSNLVAHKLDPRRGIEPDFRWIASLSSEPAVCFVGEASEFTTMDALIAGPAKLAAGAPSTANYAHSRIVERAMNANVQIISGFQSGMAANRSVQSGETDGSCGISLYAFLSSPFSKGKTILGFFGPTPIEDYKDRAGENLMNRVTDPLDRRAVGFLTDAKATVFTYWMHRDTPEALVQQHVEAFEHLLQDPAFLADIKRVLPVLTPKTGAALEQFVTDLLDVDDDVIARAREIAR